MRCYTAMSCYYTVVQIPGFIVFCNGGRLMALFLPATLLSGVRASARRLCTVLLLLLSLLPATAGGQRYAVINYTMASGYPGHIAYSVTKDSRGYIWIGSENGLVRFNGYEFKTYTTKDGLPDNEVFGIREDPQRRLWLLSFSNTPHFLFNDSVYKPEKSSILAGIRFNTHIDKVIDDRDGAYWFITSREVVRLSRDGQIHRIRNPRHLDQEIETGRTAEGYVWMTLNGVLYEYQAGKWTFIRKLDSGQAVIGQYGSAWITRLGSGPRITIHDSSGPRNIDLPAPFNGYGRLNLALARIWPMTVDSALYLLNLQTGRIADSFFNLGIINSCIGLDDGSYWVGTRGNGAFRLVSTPVRSWASSGIQPGILFIKGSGTRFVATVEAGQLVRGRLSGNALRTTHLQKLIRAPFIRRHVYLGRDNAGNWISGNELISRIPGSGKGPLSEIGVFVKAYFDEDPGHVLLGSITGLYRLDKNRFAVTDTLLRRRVTSVAKIGDVIYAGTLDGLFACLPDGKVVPAFGELPAFRERNPALCAAPDSTLWIASNRASVIAIKKGRPTAYFDAGNGLQCNMIRCMKASARYIWVGTDRGLFAISRSAPHVIVRNLRYANGLISDDINCLDIDSGRVWVGTAGGVSTFDERDVFQPTAPPRLIVNSVRDERNLMRDLSGVITLPGKTLTIDFDVIDFSGGARPAFQYRLNGEGSWLGLESSMLYFPSTPYGAFSVSLRASSSNGSDSNTLKLRFYRQYPLYLRPWFIALAGAGTVLLLAAAAAGFVRRTRSKAQEKLRTQQNLLQLEQMALQGQMNPHFIFNCITAIQHFYSNGDTDRADRFVDKFAALIRQTFEMTSHTFVPLEQELQYLRHYLEIEEERFNHTFSSRMDTDLELPPARIPIPAMLLQPFVENAVRHGVRHLPDGTGRITVSVRQQGTDVELAVTDNGIGRASSRRLRSGMARFTSLTSTTVNRKRIEVLNRLFGDKIEISITDATDCGEAAAGTVVRIRYPLNIDTYAN
jgi:ligand-binding sensor domain-containing protein